MKKILLMMTMVLGLSVLAQAQTKEIKPECRPVGKSEGDIVKSRNSNAGFKSRHRRRQESKTRGL
jgi:hypothetical protein